MINATSDSKQITMLASETCEEGDSAAKQSRAQDVISMQKSTHCFGFRVEGVG